MSMRTHDWTPLGGVAWLAVQVWMTLLSWKARKRFRR